MKANQIKLDIVEAKRKFKDDNLKLTTTYNLETNSKNKRRHPPIVNALIKNYRDKSQ